jgi:hypothetical protein
MAYRTWKHYCKVEKKERSDKNEICPDCNERGKYAGWRHSVVEFMCMYASGTRLAPYGPHRAFADTLLFPSFRAKCPKCNGRKIVDDGHGNYKDCDLCPSGLYIFNGTPEEHAAIRKQVLTAYPGFGSPKEPEMVIATTEPAPEPPPPPNEPAPQPPSSPVASPGAFFTRPANKSPEAVREMAKGIVDAIQKAFEDIRNPQISNHRSKYTYLLRWWEKRGGTFYVKIDGIELRAISHPEVTLAIFFIESPFVASVIVDWNLANLSVKTKDVRAFRKAIPCPDHFEVIGDSAYLTIDDSFTQPMFDQLLDALASLDKAIM